MRAIKGLILFIIFTSITQPAFAMSLVEAVALAVTTNPQVLSLANSRLAVDQELRQGQALYLPQLQVSARAGYGFADNSTTRFQRQAGLPVTDEQFRRSAVATLSQLIFDGFAADTEVARQRARVRGAAYRVLGASEQIGLDAVQAYIEVYRNRQRVMIAEHNVQVHLRTLEIVKERAALGAGTEADVQQTESRLASAQTALNQTRGALVDAETMFNRVVGQPADDLPDPVAPVADLPTDLESALANAYANSPLIAFAQADVVAADEEARQQYAPFYPDVRLQLQGQTSDEIDGRTIQDTGATGEVVVNWNLYRGGGDLARVRQFKHLLAQAQENLNQQNRQVTEEIRQAWNQMNVSFANVLSLQKAVDAARQTRELYLQQYEIGQRGVLDLLDADAELYQTSDQLITARAGLIFQQFRLLSASGLLIRSLGVQPVPQGQVPVVRDDQ